MGENEVNPLVQKYMDDCDTKWEQLEGKLDHQNNINDSTKTKLTQVVERVAELSRRSDKNEDRVSRVEVRVESIPSSLETGVKRFQMQDDKIESVARRIMALEPKRTPWTTLVGSVIGILSVVGVTAKAVYDRPTHAELDAQILPIQAAQKQLEEENRKAQLDILLKLQTHTSMFEQLKESVDELKRVTEQERRR